MWSHKTGSRRGQVVARPVLTVCKYSMIIYFFLNDECAIVNSIARLSLLDMNWIVCT